jgi:hypothetical protein
MKEQCVQQGSCCGDATGLRLNLGSAHQEGEGA